MKKNIFLIATLALVSIQGVSAQYNILNAKAPDAIGVKTEDQLAYDNSKPLE